MASDRFTTELLARIAAGVPLHYHVALEDGRAGAAVLAAVATDRGVRRAA